MSHECHSILHFQNVTADDNDEDVMLSDENDTYGNYSNGNAKDYFDYEYNTTNNDTDMDKEGNATLFPMVRFLVLTSALIHVILPSFHFTFSELFG